MTPEQFCYWLQGRAELQPDMTPTKAEWKMIREHLQTVFTKITPPLQLYFPRMPADFQPPPWTATCSSPPANQATTVC